MSHCRWKQSRAAAAALLTTWGLKRLTEPIVVAWLLAVCFSGSLIRRRKTEWAPQTAALLDLRPLDRIKWFPLLHRELLLPSVRLQLEPRLLFLAMFASGRNFRRFNGTWAIVHSLLYGTLPSFPQRAQGGGSGGRRLRDVSKVNSKQDCLVYVTLNTSNISPTLNSPRGWDELRWYFICM